MESDIKIRKAEIGDLEDILRLNFELFKKEHNDYDKSLNLDWTYNEGKKYFSEKITGIESFIQIAESDDKIVGYLCGGISERNSFRIMAKYAELENMYIDENFRNKGIGKKLVDNFMSWCKENDVNYAKVTAYAQNEQGINFYKQRGFINYDLTLQMIIS